MPSVSEHLKWANGNTSDTAAISASGAFNWAAVAAFYAALHFVEAYRVHYNLPEFNNHRTRNRWVQIDANLSGFSAEYKRLYDASWYCRYMGARPKQRIVQNLIDLDLNTVRVHILGLLPNPR